MYRGGGPLLDPGLPRVSPTGSSSNGKEDRRGGRGGVRFMLWLFVLVVLLGVAFATGRYVFPIHHEVIRVAPRPLVPDRWTSHATYKVAQFAQLHEGQMVDPQSRFYEEHNKLREVIVILGAEGTNRQQLAKNMTRQLHYALLVSYNDVRLLHLKGESEAGPLERALTLDNCMLLLKNYVAHGYYNIIFEGVPDTLVDRIPLVLDGLDYAVLTTTVPSEKDLRARMPKHSPEAEIRRAWVNNLRHMRRNPFPTEHRVNMADPHEWSLTNAFDFLARRHLEL